METDNGIDNSEISLKLSIDSLSSSSVSFGITYFNLAFELNNFIEKNGFKDYVITEPSKISHIYGFDFNEKSIELIKDIIDNC